jgi:hypothetical protein
MLKQFSNTYLPAECSGAAFWITESNRGARHTVLRDVIAGFLDTVTEREFDAPS